MTPSKPYLVFRCTDDSKDIYESVSAPPKREYHSIPGVCVGCALAEAQKEIAKRDEVIEYLKNLTTDGVLHYAADYFLKHGVWP